MQRGLQGHRLVRRVRGTCCWGGGWKSSSCVVCTDPAGSKAGHQPAMGGGRSSTSLCGLFSLQPGPECWGASVHPQSESLGSPTPGLACEGAASVFCVCWSGGGGCGGVWPRVFCLIGLPWACGGGIWLPWELRRIPSGGAGPTVSPTSTLRSEATNALEHAPSSGSPSPEVPGKGPLLRTSQSLPCLQCVGRGGESAPAHLRGLTGPARSLTCPASLLPPPGRVLPADLSQTRARCHTHSAP